MKTYEDEIKEAIKKQYGSIRKMSLVTGIPATTIYHALERGIDNTTVKTRHMILESLPFMRESILYSSVPIENESENLSDEEQELVDIMRSITPQGQQQLMLFARGVSSTFTKNNQVRGIEETA